MRYPLEVPANLSSLVEGFDLANDASGMGATEYLAETAASGPEDLLPSRALPHDAAEEREQATALLPPAVPQRELLTKSEEQELGRILRESRLEMTAALSRVPAAFGVFARLMMQADAGERPTTDALFAPFDAYEPFTHDEGAPSRRGAKSPRRWTWRQVAHAARQLYHHWCKLVAATPDGIETRAARERLGSTMLRISPGVVALREAMYACVELDREVSTVEAERGAFHADILKARPQPSTHGIRTRDGGQPRASVASRRRADDAGKLHRIQTQAGVDLTTLRDSCRKAEAAHARYIEARDKMVSANLGLAYSMAHRLRGNGVSFDDLVQEALLGLMRAVEKYDYRMGYKFSTYAVQWIRQATTRAIADASRTIRVAAHVHDDIVRIKKLGRKLEQRHGRAASVQELSDEAQMPEWKVERARRLSHQPLSLDAPTPQVEDSPLSSVIEDTTLEDPRASVHDAKLAEKVASILEELPQREALIVRLRHGIGGTEVHTLEEIGRILNITRERTRQLEGRAFKRLRERMSGDFLQGTES